MARLKENYEQRIAVAPSADKERIAAKAINAVSKAVTDQGLSIDEYNSILEVAQANPEVLAAETFARHVARYDVEFPPRPWPERALPPPRERAAGCDGRSS